MYIIQIPFVRTLVVNAAPSEADRETLNNAIGRSKRIGNQMSVTLLPLTLVLISPHQLNGTVTVAPNRFQYPLGA